MQPLQVDLLAPRPVWEFCSKFSIPKNQVGVLLLVCSSDELLLSPSSPALNSTESCLRDNDSLVFNLTLRAGPWLYKGDIKRTCPSSAVALMLLMPEHTERDVAPAAT